MGPIFWGGGIKQATNVKCMALLQDFLQDIVHGLRFTSYN